MCNICTIIYICAGGKTCKLIFCLYIEAFVSISTFHAAYTCGCLPFCLLFVTFCFFPCVFLRTCTCLFAYLLAFLCICIWKSLYLCANILIHTFVHEVYNVCFYACVIACVCLCCKKYFSSRIIVRRHACFGWSWANPSSFVSLPGCLHIHIYLHKYTNSIPYCVYFTMLLQCQQY